MHANTSDSFSYAMDTDDFVRWISSIGLAIERLSDDSPGAPDFEIRHLAQIQQFLASQLASIRNQST